jgi:hypothetical protein
LRDRQTVTSAYTASNACCGSKSWINEKKYRNL